MATAIIAGAGPAGLTAAYELLSQTDVHPVIFEATDEIGGISRTVKHNGYRMDIGGHRFFSKNKQVMDWWEQVMPMQGSRSKDDILLDLDDKKLSPDGPDPEREDRVMLLRHRVSRIFWLQRFFDYPIRMKMETFSNMGLWRTVKAGWGFMAASVRKRPETSLENFYINRFGRPLYSMFFEDYTEKVWGIHPRDLGADWGSQRVKGLSVSAVIKDMLASKFKKKRDSQQVETSLIEEYIYPKYGPGQLWELVADDIRAKGGEVKMQSCVTGVNILGDKVVSVETTAPDGTVATHPCDYFLSTMPIKDLVAAIKGVEVPDDVRRIASNLYYRDFITVGLAVKKLKITNRTKIKTYAGRIPDTWIYIQEREVRLGRLQVFNNWSPYLVKDYQDVVWIGLEYFCNEGDEKWQMSEGDFIEMAIDELVRINIIDREDVIDTHQVKVKKAYPTYYGTYYELDTVRRWLDSITNLYCLGRNGQHRYNNMDHSMLTAMECVSCIKNGSLDKSSIWEVNTEKEYHETK